MQVFPLPAMNKPSDDIALDTLTALEERLRRVEWYLSGSDDVQTTLQGAADQGRDHTAQARLQSLESNLSRLVTQSPTVRNLLILRESCYCLV